MSSTTSTSSSSSKEWTDNEGESTDCEQEAPANPSLRSRAALVTAKCPRHYYRNGKVRKDKMKRIPEDMTKQAFLKAFRDVVGTECNQSLLAATCHEVFHKRKRRSTKRQEKKYHIAVKMSNNFPHKKITEAFKDKHGIGISFNFKMKPFSAVVGYLLQEGLKPATELDTQPAKYPASLDLAAELPSTPAAPPRMEPAQTQGKECPEEASQEDVWTSNEGDSTDEEEVAPAESSLRGSTALVTASCPRQYPREFEERKAQGCLIPDDFSKEEFLAKLRKTIAKCCTVKMEKATCHDEPHKRFRPSLLRRERHKHVALKMSGNFAHKKIADAFQKEHGIRISFSFKLNRFVANLAYLMEPGKKPSTDLDLNPARYPTCLDLQKELRSAKHAGEQDPKESRKRKRLSFDEVSNIIIEGIGDGPLRTPKVLEDAARTLKHKGQVELWNYLGNLKSSSETCALVAKVWRLQGELAHPMWNTEAPYPLEAFRLDLLSEAQQWLGGKYKTHALIFSGDGDLGKTSAAEAMIRKVCPAGYWFIDDPDDFRELEGQILEEHGLIIDEITLVGFPVNQIKKLFDLEKTRRIKCRHFNATVPKGCARIFCTNSGKNAFYPKIPDKKDEKGVMRRQLFQVVCHDLRIRSAALQPEPSPTLELPCTQDGGLLSQGMNVCWPGQLKQTCEDACLLHRYAALHAAAEELGVAWWCEVLEFAHEMMDMIGLKSLERRRFLSHLQD
jgi:hypothetical protein